MKVSFFVLFGVYLIVNALGLAIGSQEPSSPIDSCLTPVTKIEVVFPGYRIGCWMGQPLSK